MKRFLSYLLRKTNLLELADYGMFFLSYIKHRGKNSIFRKNHPATILPPPFMLFESFGKLDYTAYFDRGRESAEGILEIIAKHRELKNKKILEWGCGPSRVLRHLPVILKDSGCGFYGSDYNKETISWCRKNLSGVEFETNELKPPISYPDESIDIIYAISVFTHLDASTQKEWFRECMRIMKRQGIFLFTTHGDLFKNRLFAKEQQVFEKEGVSIRGNVTEGKRSYTTFNSADYVKSVLIKGSELAEYIPGTKNEQDIWIVRKL